VTGGRLSENVTPNAPTDRLHGVVEVPLHGLAIASTMPAVSNRRVLTKRH